MADSGNMDNMITLDYLETPLMAYQARPDGDAKGGVIVIHEVWGLNAHTKDIAHRFAAEGYVAVAPELLGETDIARYAAQMQLDLFNPKTRNETQPKLRELMAPMREPGFAEKTLGRLQACFDYLVQLPVVHGRVAVVGFCFGGSYSFSLAMAEPQLMAAVPFYGHVDVSDPERLKQISCPVLAFYGEKDEGLMASLPEVKEAMRAAGTGFTPVVYPDAGHAFFNDTNPYAYNEAAAKDAWQKTLDFLQKGMDEA